MVALHYVLLGLRVVAAYCFVGVDVVLLWGLRFGFLLACGWLFVGYVV